MRTHVGSISWCVLLMPLLLRFPRGVRSSLKSNNISTVTALEKATHLQGSMSRSRTAADCPVLPPCHCVQHRQVAVADNGLRVTSSTFCVVFYPHLQQKKYNFTGDKTQCSFRTACPISLPGCYKSSGVATGVRAAPGGTC